MARAVGAAVTPRRWRKIGLGLAAALLAAPIVAMQLTPEVAWGPGDFMILAGLLAVLGVGIEAAARMRRDRWFLAGAAVALASAILLVAVNLAVGVLGSEGNRANLLFAGVIALAAAGSALARGRAASLARAMRATALAQALVAALALAAGWASPGWHGLYEVALGTILFGGLWLIAAALFARAAEGEAEG
jgi:hypothetical protein